MTQTVQSETTNGGGFTAVTQALESSVSISSLPEWRESTPFVTSQGLEVRMVPPSLLPTFQQLNDKLFVETVYPMVDARSSDEAMKSLIPLWTRFMEISAVRDGVAEMLVTQGESLPESLNRELVLKAGISVLGTDTERSLGFALSTYARALRLADRVNAATLPSEETERDAHFATIFHRGAAMHAFGVSVLLELARRAADPASVPQWKRELTCIMIREGALAAHMGVSQGARLRPELRRTRKTPMPSDFRFDDEDVSLANLDG